MSCSEAEKNDGIQLNDMLLHNCSKCGVIFELIEGCSDVKCSHCNYSFCWVCGSDNNSCFHNFMKIGCQVINLTFKFNIKSKCMRGIIIILFLLIILPLLIFLICVFIPIFLITQYYSPRRLGGRKRVCLCLPSYICNHIFWQYKGPNRCFRYMSRIFISLPFWVVLSALSLKLAFVITSVLIIPTWVLSVISIIKMIIWWRKKDKIG